MQFTQSKEKDMWERRVLFLSMEGKRQQQCWKEKNFEIVSIRIIHRAGEFTCIICSLDYDDW